MRIVEVKHYNGAQNKIRRLGIKTFDEVLQLLTGIDLRLQETADSNSGAAVREMIDAEFARSVGWTNTQTGDIDWRKCFETHGTQVCMGVEIQVSARSDLVVIDVMHLRDAIEGGSIDLGVLVVPSDRLAGFLTDRAPSYRETIRVIEERTRSEHLPLVVVAIEHDGPGSALPKRRKKH
jgi:hypothetical protein